MEVCFCFKRQSLVCFLISDIFKHFNILILVLNIKVLKVLSALNCGLLPLTLANNLTIRRGLKTGTSKRTQLKIDYQFNINYDMN